MSISNIFFKRLLRNRVVFERFVRPTSRKGVATKAITTSTKYRLPP